MKPRSAHPAGNAGPSPWPHRWSVVLALATFPLIWVGGLVTSTDAGMAVPDWPGTYGYNLFLYPWQTWLFGPWDLFIEHGHRLLGSAVGLITIGLLVSVWRDPTGRPLRGLALAALGLVVFQGVLGGLRVVLSQRPLAMAHGITGPGFFALACVLAALTRPLRTDDAEARGGPLGYRRLLLTSATLAYVQLGLGAQLRHVAEETGPWAFSAVVRMHLALAVLLMVHFVSVGVQSARVAGLGRGARRLGVGLALLAAGQFSLGLATWLAKYAAPGWAQLAPLVRMDATVAGGWLQTVVVTAHSALGSLLLGLTAYAAASAQRHASLPDPHRLAPRGGPLAAAGGPLAPRDPGLRPHTPPQ